jgi:chromate transporter
LKAVIKLLELFLMFAKIGLFTIGGGYAMIAIIEDAVVSQRKWMTHDEMMELIVIAESTPGPIAINCATYVGYRRKGILGAAVSTLGMVTPSLVIIYTISMFLENFLEIAIIANAFHGIKVGVGIVIINAGLNMMKKVKKAALPRGLVAFGLIAMLAVNFLSLNISSIALMLTAGIVSLAVFKVKGGIAE